MSITIKSLEELKSLIDALTNEAVDANIHYRLYKDLKDSVKTYEREYNQTQTFWSLTFQAHLEAAIFHLCKVYDQNDGSLNLRNILRLIEKNLSITSKKLDENQLNEDIKYVGNDNELVGKLTIWRNNLYAHIQPKNVIRKEFIDKKYPLTYENIDELLTKGITILNRYSSIFFNSTYSSTIVGHDDYRIILASIKENLIQIENKRDEERVRINNMRSYK